MESETSGDSTRRSNACFRSALVYCQTQTLAPAVSIRRPPCPRGSVIPFDAVPTHPTAEVVPVASANIAITIHIQFRRIAVFVSRFQPALIGVYFGRLVRVTVHIPPSLQDTTVPASGCDHVEHRPLVNAFFGSANTPLTRMRRSKAKTCFFIYSASGLLVEQSRCHGGQHVDTVKL